MNTVKKSEAVKAEENGVRFEGTDIQAARRRLRRQLGQCTMSIRGLAQSVQSKEVAGNEKKIAFAGQMITEWADRRAEVQRELKILSIADFCNSSVAAVRPIRHELSRIRSELREEEERHQRRREWIIESGRRFMELMGDTLYLEASLAAQDRLLVALQAAGMSPAMLREASRIIGRPAEELEAVIVAAVQRHETVQAGRAVEGKRATRRRA